VSRIARRHTHELAADAVAWHRRGLDINSFVDCHSWFFDPDDFMRALEHGMTDADLRLTCLALDRRPFKQSQRWTVGARLVEWWSAGWGDPAELATLATSRLRTVQFDECLRRELVDLALMGDILNDLCG
jgi:hypothetical protein